MRNRFFKVPKLVNFLLVRYILHWFMSIFFFKRVSFIIKNIYRCMYCTHVPDAYRGQKKMLGAGVTQVIVSFLMGVLGIWIWVHRKSSKYSWVLSPWLSLISKWILAFILYIFSTNIITLPNNIFIALW